MGLVDQYGRALRASDGFSLGSGSSPLYDAAGTGHRLRAWQPGLTGPNAALIYAADTLRARCRDLVRKNPWAVNAINKSVSNVVGAGIMPQSMAPDPYKAQIEELWADSVGEMDSRGRLDFAGCQALLWRTVLEGGEGIVRNRFRLRQDRLAVPLQMQILEAEHLPEFYNMQMPNGDVVRAGIQFKAGMGDSTRVAYWLYQEHPGDRALFLSDNLIPVSVPAFVDGIPNVMHVHPILRPGQMRGLPWLVPVLTRLYEIDQYEDAALVTAKIQQLFSAFLTKNAPDDSVVGENTQTAREATTDLALEAGTIQVLLAGENLVFSEPKGQTNIKEFFRAVMLAIAAGLGLTYEQLTGAMDGVNYSSARVALLEFRRACEQYQRQVMIFQFCQPFFNAWLDTAVVSGALKLPGYAESPRKYRRVKWHPPRWDWVNPKDDVEADRKAVEAAFKSRSRVISEMGDDPEQVDAEIARDQAREKKLGINPQYGTVRVTETGAVPDNVEKGKLPTELL
jgi:lambda family phage portal protein